LKSETHGSEVTEYLTANCPDFRFQCTNYFLIKISEKGVIQDKSNQQYHSMPEFEYALDFDALSTGSAPRVPFLFHPKIYLTYDSREWQ